MATSTTSTSLGRNNDIVGVWNVPLKDEVHRVEFEHGTTTGRRVVRVDGHDVVRREWMFKLVGNETFHIGDAVCVIVVEALGSFAYQYSLEVNGQKFEKFREEQTRKMQGWRLRHAKGGDLRISLDKQTMDVWANGLKIDTTGEFVDDGTETKFTVDERKCIIRSFSSGSRREGVSHELIVDGVTVPPTEIIQ